jgi:hypothetical protein
MLALMHNIYFVGLLLSDVLKPNALIEFANLIAVNRTIVELAVDGTTPTKVCFVFCDLFGGKRVKRI